MSARKRPRLAVLAFAGLIVAGCAAPAKKDFPALRSARPTSILVLPPLNKTPEVNASPGFYAQVTLPLAESGYYVLPVTLVEETFRQNGLDQPGEIHALPLAKLREFFGADAALYIEIEQYGTVYMVIGSESRVTASAKLVDLRTGEALWQGRASASSAEGRSSSGGLIGALVGAVVSQIVETLSDHSHKVAATTAYRLLSADMPGGLIHGPRSPKAGKEGL